MKFLLALAWRTDPFRLCISAAFMLIGYLSTPFIGVLLKGFTDTREPGYAFGVALLLVFELMMVHFAHLYYFELGELMAASLDEELVQIANGSPGLSHFDDPEFADALTLARQDVTQTRPALEGILHLGGHGLRALTTTVILATVNPWLALLPLAAIPPVLISRRSHALIDRARQTQAERSRLSNHLITLATSADAVKEIRLSGAAPFLMRVQLADWEYESAALARAQWRAAALRSLGQLLFAIAYGATIVLVVNQKATLGEMILVVTLAVQISLQVAAALGLVTGVQAASKTIDRLIALRKTPTPATGSAAAPTRLTSGVTLDRMSFAYPNGRSILDDISLHIPAGASVALVGENGAGKSTLVKLLCGFYTPTSGRITVDGFPLSEIDPALWRERVAFLFQDLARFELLLRENVGTGALSRLDDDDALAQALRDARFTGSAGLNDLVGHSYGDGAEMSGGQWQQAGLARTLMRQGPLLLALDEPAAALDAQAESALFERFVATARAAARSEGAITLFTSHRFSTVRLADLIVVLDNGRVHEHGTHESLMAANGLYSELFALQARAYA